MLGGGYSISSLRQRCQENMFLSSLASADTPQYHIHMMIYVTILLIDMYVHVRCYIHLCMQLCMKQVQLPIYDQRVHECMCNATVRQEDVALNPCTYVAKSGTHLRRRPIRYPIGLNPTNPVPAPPPTSPASLRMAGTTHQRVDALAVDWLPSKSTNSCWSNVSLLVTCHTYR
jgi:hypothetical protein